MITRRFSGERLRTLRVAAGFATQHDLAQRMGLRERQIQRWEAGDHEPRIEAVAALADVLGVRIDDLFTDDTEPTDA